MTLAIADDDLDPAIHLYRDAFADLNSDTVMDHMLTLAKLEALFADKRFRKYTAWDAAGELVGLSTITNDLRAQKEMTDISLPFFEKHYPDEYAEDESCRIWYIGFVCTRPDGHPRETFVDLVTAMMAPIRESRGVGVLDYSSVVMSRKLDVVSKRIIGRIAPLDEAVELGSQHWFGYRFRWPQA
jgi:hypothetical protein